MEIYNFEPMVRFFLIRVGVASKVNEMFEFSYSQILNQVEIRGLTQVIAKGKKEL